MEELFNITLPTNIVHKRKKIAVKRIHPHSDQTKHINIHLVAHPKSINIIAYYNTRTSGYFLNQDDPTDDFFYKCLQSLKSQHLELLGEDESSIIYNSPHTPQGFTFKSSKKILICKDKSGIIRSHDCTGKKCIFVLRVKPYDFIDIDQRRVGLSIQISSVFKI
jgi:hypothetical protein